MSKNLLNAKNPVIPTYFQRILFRMLVERGVCESLIFDGLGLQKEKFLDDSFRLSFDQHTKFIKNALAATGDPHLGWQFGQKIQITALGLPGYAIMSSENGKEAVETLTHFFKLRAPSYELKLSSASDSLDDTVLTIEETFDFGEVRYFMLSSIVSAFEHVFNFFTRESNVIERVEFGCDEPNEFKQLSNVSEYPIGFGYSSTKIFLNSDFLNKALPTADSDTKKTTENICQEMLSRIDNQTGITREIYEYIIKKKGSYPSLSEVANNLSISPRTLRRELQKSNTTYQKMLDNIRLNTAKELLLNTSKKTCEIAFELGFKDTSNFNRAFKKWTGLTPGQFRS